MVQTSEGKTSAKSERFTLLGFFKVAWTFGTLSSAFCPLVSQELTLIILSSCCFSLNHFHLRTYITYGSRVCDLTNRSKTSCEFLRLLWLIARNIKKKLISSGVGVMPPNRFIVDSIPEASTVEMRSI